MYIVNTAIAIQKMPVNEIRDFIFETYYKRIGLSKENNFYSINFWKENICCDSN